MASQFGVTLPSHRFPTDTSFHASYNLGLGSTSANYSDQGVATELSGTQKVSWVKNSVQLEYQPSNQFSVGGNFTFQRTSLGAEGAAASSAWSLGDQTIFAEYRILDAPGYSVGLSGIIKFPGYQNSTPEEANTLEYALLPGDAQTDFGGMLSTEFWPTNVLRLQADFGYLIRTQAFANEVIYQGSVGFVIPRVDLSFRMIGFNSVGAGATPGSDIDQELSSVQTQFAGSQYAYSTTPTLLMMSPKVEFWIGPEYAITGTYTKTLNGSEAAKGQLIEIGFVYRFVERKTNTRRGYTETDIDYDQNSGVFDGETQEKARRKDSTPRPDFDFEPLYYEPGTPQ